MVLRAPKWPKIVSTGVLQPFFQIFCLYERVLETVQTKLGQDKQ